MSTNVTIHEAAPVDARDVAAMTGELLGEISAAVGEAAFDFELTAATALLERFLHEASYFVLVARDAGAPVGFCSMYEARAVYAGGVYGTIAELYVRPAHRSGETGRLLVARARELATARRWRRLEVTTPPLPEFDRTLAFYRREGFSVAGGRKLKLVL